MPRAFSILFLANSLKPHEYGLITLPMIIVKRFHDCLIPTHDKVLAYLLILNAPDSLWEKAQAV